MAAAVPSPSPGSWSATVADLLAELDRTRAELNEFCLRAIDRSAQHGKAVARWMRERAELRAQVAELEADLQAKRQDAEYVSAAAERRIKSLGDRAEAAEAERDAALARVAELEASWVSEPRATDNAVNALATAVYPSMGEAVASAMAHNIRLAHAPEQPCAPHQFGGFTAACCVDCGHPLAADCHPKDGDHHA